MTPETQATVLRLHRARDQQRQLIRAAMRARLARERRDLPSDPVPPADVTRTKGGS
jgi:hypothetical protein